MSAMLARLSMPGPWVAGLLALAIGLSAAQLGVMALALVVALPVAAVLLWQPRWCFWVLVASIPVTIEFGSGLTVTRLLLPLVAVSLLVNAVLRRGPWLNPFGSPAGLAFVVFCLGLGVSVLVARGMPGAAGDAVRINKELTGYITRLALFIVTLTMVRTVRDVRAVFAVVVVAGVLEALVVVAQVHFRLVLPGNWRAAQINNVVGSVGSFRAEGTTPHPIFLAGYLQMVLPFAVALALRAGWWGRLAAGSAMALLLYAWSSAVSRSSMLGMVMMVAVALCLWSRLGRALVIGLVVLLVLGLSAHGWDFGQFARTLESLRHFGSDLRPEQLTSSAGALQFRMESSAGAWNLFLAHPLLGVGLGGAYHHYMAYLPPWSSSPFHPQDIHNAFLGVAADMGVVAFGALLALWAFALAGVRRAWHDPELGLYARALLAALLGQLVFQLLNPMVRDMWFTTALAAALGQVMRLRAAPGTASA